MNRREFIYKACQVSGMLLTGGLLTNMEKAFANNNILEKMDLSLANDFTLDSMVSNHFQFRSLVERSLTNQVVIHHTGTGKNNITAQEVHNLHLKFGWSGIGYHLFIRKDGIVETGRPLIDVGAHTYGHNQNTVGVCLAGNFEYETPTDSQLAAATKVVAKLCKMYELKPNNACVVGHRDLNATACPGNNFYPRLYDLRERVGQLV